MKKLLSYVVVQLILVSMLIISVSAEKVALKQINKMYKEYERKGVKMKFVLALLIIVPTLIAILLFSVAGFAYASPAMLDAAINPTVAVLCIIAGVIALLPLIVIIAIGLSNILKIGKNKEDKGEKTKR